MANGQPITKGEMLEVLANFHERVVRKDMAKILFDFHEKVQEPMTEEILTRLKNVELDLKNGVGRLELKLDKVTDHQAEKLDDHEDRIVRIEAVV
ncbi:MAG: hypothetical protein AAB973_03505 [Patescibacteria group bacterium]